MPSAIGALLVNALVWGLSWLPLRELQRAGIHPLWATALIYGIALVGLSVWRPSTWRGLVRHPTLLLLMAAAGLSNVGFNWAVTTGDVVRVVLLFYLMPAWAVIWARLLLREKPTPYALLRVGVSLAGVLFVLHSPDSPWPLPHDLSDMLALSAGLCFALTNVLLLRLRDTPDGSRVLAMFAGGALLAALTAVIGLKLGLTTPLPAPDGASIAWLLLCSLAFVGGNLALQYGAARLPANTTALVMVSEIVFASASSIVLGAAHWSAQTAVGGAMILLAAFWAAQATSGD